MNNLIRRRVSQNRKRFVEGRYDLDLTYITDNIIAMGYPSDKAMQSIIRNHIAQVSRFLIERHPNSFKIFNLCAESDYDFKYFQNMVECIPFADHSPPRFAQISEFCAKVDSWLKEKIKNVVIVHCKAGKGRTGTMISCYLVHSKRCATPFEAMSEFGHQRTKDQRGVTIPSQRRYVEYYGLYLKSNLICRALDIKIKSINLSQEKSFEDKYLCVQIHCPDTLKKCYESQLVKHNSEGTAFNLDISDSKSISGDTKIIFFNKAKDIVFSVTFNSFCSFNNGAHENEYSLNKNSYQGKKRLNHDGNVVWTLTKKLIDGGAKNKNLDNHFKLEFEIEMVHKKPSQVQQVQQAIPESVQSDPISAENTIDTTNLVESEEDPSSSTEKEKKNRMKEVSEMIRRMSKPGLHSTLLTRIRNKQQKQPVHKSIYRSNSEPFLNSTFFQGQPPQKTTSIESLDLELEKNYDQKSNEDDFY